MTFDTVIVAGQNNCEAPRRAPSHARLLPAILQPGKHHTSVVTVESEPTRTLTVIACCLTRGGGARSLNSWYAASLRTMYQVWKPRITVPTSEIFHENPLRFRLVDHLLLMNLFYANYVTGYVILAQLFENPPKTIAFALKVLCLGGWRGKSLSFKLEIIFF